MTEHLPCDDLLWMRKKAKKRVEAVTTLPPGGPCWCQHCFAWRSVVWLNSHEFSFCDIVITLWWLFGNYDIYGVWLSNYNRPADQPDRPTVTKVYVENSRKRASEKARWMEAETKQMKEWERRSREEQLLSIVPKNREHEVKEKSSSWRVCVLLQYKSNWFYGT